MTRTAGDDEAGWSGIRRDRRRGRTRGPGGDAASRRARTERRPRGETRSAGRQLRDERRMVRTVRHALQRRAGVEDSDDLFLADMVETGGGFADEALLRALVERQANAVAAIDHAGAWTDELKVSAGMSVARAHLIRIRDLLAHLEDEAVAAGAVILPRTRGRRARHGMDPGWWASRPRAESSSRARGSSSPAGGSRARASCSSSSCRTRRRPCRTAVSATRATGFGWPGCWVPAWPTSGTSPAPTASTPKRPTTSTSC